MSVVLLTFGAGSKRYYDAICRLKKQAESFPFDKIITYNDLDLIQKFPDFWSQHKDFILNSPRGFGYWLWKPFIMLETMKTLKEGDILVYIDCGCELNIKGLDRFKEYLNTVKKNNSLLFHLEEKHTEWQWNKMDLISHLGMQDHKSLFLPQTVGGIQLHKCCKENIKFLEEYYNTCCKYNLIDDSPSKIPNTSQFIEHRHDQSVASLLAKKYNYYAIADETWPDNMLGNKSRYPIWAIRNYSIESKIKF